MMQTKSCVIKIFYSSTIPVYGTMGTCVPITCNIVLTKLLTIKNSQIRGVVPISLYNKYSSRMNSHGAMPLFSLIVGKLTGVSECDVVHEWYT